MKKDWSSEQKMIKIILIQNAMLIVQMRVNLTVKYAYYYTLNIH